jgi:hypothetical protein
MSLVLKGIYWSFGLLRGCKIWFAISFFLDIFYQLINNVYLVVIFVIFYKGKFEKEIVKQ